MAQHLAILCLLALLFPATVSGACGCLNLHKVYDANANGFKDGGESEITGWGFKVRNLATNAYYFYDTPSTLLLPFGSYEVCDRLPTRSNWWLTSSSLCRNYTLTTSTCVEAESDCVCTGPGNSQLSGLWWNATVMTITPADFQALRDLPLVTSSLTTFDPVDTVTTKFWYNGATATSAPGYYLSSQLALATLNLRHGFTSSGLLVKAADVAAMLGASNQFVTLGAIVSLATSKLTTSPNADAANLLLIAKNLYAINTNQNFVQPTQCTFSFPALDLSGATQLLNQCVVSTGTTGSTGTTSTGTTSSSTGTTSTGTTGTTSTGTTSTGTTGTTGCQQGCLQLGKTYDLNANGQKDAGEPDIADWKFKVTNLQTGNSAYYVTPSTLQLPFGRYQVCDVIPQQYNWWLTGRPLCQNYTLTDTTCVAGLATCLCTGPSTAQAGGYWTKTTGLASITQADLDALSAAGLVKSTLAPFTAFTKAQFVSWHNAATAANPPYWLSDQLALSILNTRHGVNPSNLIKSPTVAPLLGVTAHVFVPLSAIQDKAKELLLTPMLNQATQLVFAQALKDTNSNQNFAQSSPCFASFSAVSSGVNLAGLQPPCGGSNPSLLVDDGAKAGSLGDLTNEQGSTTATYVGASVGAAVVALAAAAGAFLAVRKLRSGRVRQLKASRSEIVGEQQI